MSPSFATLPNVLGMLDEQGGDVNPSLIPAITAALNNIPGGPKTQLSFDEVNEICFEMITRGDHTYRQNPTFTWWFEYGEHVLIRPEDVIKAPRNAPNHKPDEYKPRMDLANMRPVQEPTEPAEPKFSLFADINVIPTGPSCEKNRRRARKQDRPAVDVLALLYPPMPSPSEVFGHAKPSRAQGLSVSKVNTAKRSTLSATASPFIPGSSAGSRSTASSTSLSSAVPSLIKTSVTQSATKSSPDSAVSPGNPVPTAAVVSKEHSTKAVKPSVKDKSALVALPDPALLFGPRGPNGRSKYRLLPVTAQVVEGPPSAVWYPDMSGKPIPAINIAQPIPVNPARANAMREWVRLMTEKADAEAE